MTEYEKLEVLLSETQMRVSELFDCLRKLEGNSKDQDRKIGWLEDDVRRLKDDVSELERK